MNIDIGSVCVRNKKVDIGFGLHESLKDRRGPDLHQNQNVRHRFVLRESRKGRRMPGLQKNQMIEICSVDMRLNYLDIGKVNRWLFWGGECYVPAHGHVGVILTPQLTSPALCQDYFILSLT